MSDDRPAGPDRGSTSGSWPYTQEPVPPGGGSDLHTFEINQPTTPQPTNPQHAAPNPGPGVGAGPRRQPATQSSTDSTLRRLAVVARILWLSAGGALCAAAIVGLFVGVGEAELLIVLGGGVVLAIMPAVVDRVRSMKAGHFEIQLIEQIADNARKSAEMLRRLGMEHELDAYATIYTEMRGAELTEVRGAMLDRIVQRVSNASAVEKFDRGEVKDMFTLGSPIVRVLALGLMEGDLSLIDSEVLVEALKRPLTGNEHYHALKLVLGGWGHFPAAERAKLKDAIDSNQQIQYGPGRRELAERIRKL